MEEGRAVLMRERFDDNYEEKVVLHANVYLTFRDWNPL